MPLALVYALSTEIKPILKESKVIARIFKGKTVLTRADFRGKEIILCQTGVGTEAACIGTEELLTHFNPRVIFSVGYAGATEPTARTGDLLIVTELCTKAGDRFEIDPKLRVELESLVREEKLSYQTGPLMTVAKVANKKTKQALGREGMGGVDMESTAVAKVAKGRGIPFLSLRVIFDPIDEELLFDFKNPKALLKIPKYFRMNQLCQKRLSMVVERYILSNP